MVGCILLLGILLLQTLQQLVLDLCFVQQVIPLRSQLLDLMIDGLRVETRQPTSRSAHNLCVIHILAWTCHLSTLVQLLFHKGQLIQDFLHPCIFLILDIALDHLPQTTHLPQHLGWLDLFVVLGTFH